MTTQQPQILKETQQATEHLINFISKNKKMPSSENMKIIDLIERQEKINDPKLTDVDVLEKIARKYPGISTAEDFLKLFFDYGYITEKEHLDFYIKRKIVIDIDLALKPLSHINQNFYENVILPYLKLSITEKLEILNKNPKLESKLKKVSELTRKLLKLQTILNFSSGKIKEDAMLQQKELIKNINQELKKVNDEIIHSQKQEIAIRSSEFKKLIENARSRYATKKEIDLLIALGATKENILSWASGHIRKEEIISSKEAYISLLKRRVKANMPLSEGEFETLLNILSKEVVQKYPNKNLEKVRNDLRKKTNGSPEKLMLAFTSLRIIPKAKRSIKLKTPIKTRIK